MLTAITRAIGSGAHRCELSFIDRQPIDIAKANAQHRTYEQLLEQLGARVVSLPAENDLPDSMFVEDPAVVLDELAVILPLGTETRRPEAVSIAKALSVFRKLEYINLPGTLEGGDVLHIGRKLFVGISRRSNAEGLRQLAAILKPHDYEVIAVPVLRCLHLKSAVTYLGRGTLLANRDWFDATPFTTTDCVFNWIDVADGEPRAANALVVGDAVILAASFPRTHERVESQKFSVTSLDISELQKAEAGLTCVSLLFDDSLTTLRRRAVTNVGSS